MPAPRAPRAGAVRKAVVPANGMGTRLLPATKAVPKELLPDKGDAARLAAVRASAELAHVHVVRQGEALGLGHAVLQAATFVGDEPFAVLLGDDLIDERDHLLEHMLAVQAEHGGSVIALLDVGRENIDKYGAVAIEPGAHPVLDGDVVVTITGLGEKPPVDEAPSSLAIIGRY